MLAHQHRLGGSKKRFSQLSRIKAFWMRVGKQIVLTPLSTKTEQWRHIRP